MDNFEWGSIIVKDGYDLATLLDIDYEELRKIANQANNYYIPNEPIIKSNGDERQTYTVKEPLKTLQKQINKKIFEKINYPIYLQGSIKDDNFLRGYIHDASIHSKSKKFIFVDIRNFFDSIKVKYVRNMFTTLLCFPNDVSEMLLKLTTYKGSLPQGAATSSYIANLIFGNEEWNMVVDLNDVGLKYTRYIDDITISTNKYLTNDEKTKIFIKVYGLFRKFDLKPNRKKNKITTKKRQVTVHGLNINNGKPTMPKKKRYRIQAAVNECEVEWVQNKNSIEYKRLYAKTLGRVENLTLFHPKHGKKLKERLLLVKPDN